MKIRPPIVGLVYILLAVGLQYLFPDTKIDFASYHVLGVVFIILGIIIAIWSILLFRKIGTTKDPFGDPSTIVTKGPFRFSRNPMYLSLTVILLGIGFYVGTVLFYLVALGFFLTMNFSFIPREEKILGTTFGGKYSDYKRRVRRWL